MLGGAAEHVHANTLSAVTGATVSVAPLNSEKSAAVNPPTESLRRREDWSAGSTWATQAW